MQKTPKWLKHFLISTYGGIFFAGGGGVKIYEGVPYFVQVGWGSVIADYSM